MRSRHMRLKLWSAIAAAIALPAATLALPASAQFVSAIVNPLVARWIKSEVDSVDNLSVNIKGADNDLLGGRIAQAEVSGDNLVYKDFYLSRVELSGQDIRLTVDEALSGGSLELVEPLPVQAMLRLTDLDLNRSIQAPLIQSQLAEANVDIPVGSGGSVAFQLREPQVSILDGRLKIDALLNSDGTDVPVSVTTGLLPQNGSQLLLVNPTWLGEGGVETPIAGLEDLAIDLGPDVAIGSLQLQAGQLIYNGIVTIQP